MTRSATSGSHTIAATAATARITPLTRRVIQVSALRRPAPQAGNGNGHGAVAAAGVEMPPYRRSRF
jgi:hypothetical protein